MRKCGFKNNVKIEPFKKKKPEKNTFLKIRFYFTRIKATFKKEKIRAKIVDIRILSALYLGEREIKVCCAAESYNMIFKNATISTQTRIQYTDKSV